MSPPHACAILSHLKLNANSATSWSVSRTWRLAQKFFRLLGSLGSPRYTSNQVSMQIFLPHQLWRSRPSDWKRWWAEGPFCTQSVILLCLLGSSLRVCGYTSPDFRMSLAGSRRTGWGRSARDGSTEPSGFCTTPVHRSPIFTYYTLCHLLWQSLSSSLG